MGRPIRGLSILSAGGNRSHNQHLARKYNPYSLARLNGIPGGLHAPCGPWRISVRQRSADTRVATASRQLSGSQHVRAGSGRIVNRGGRLPHLDGKPGHRR